MPIKNKRGKILIPVISLGLVCCMETGSSAQSLDSASSTYIAENGAGSQGGVGDLFGSQHQAGNGQPLENTILAPPISFVDVNTGKFGKLELDIEDGEFHHGSCKNLHVVARDMDLNKGELKSLDISVLDGHYQDFIFDRLTLATRGSMNFDTGVFLNHQTLQFVQPVDAEVVAEISQESLGKFLNAPSTLDKLSLTAGKNIGFISKLFGGKPPNVGMSVSDAKLSLERSDKVNLQFLSKVGLGQYALPIPVEIQSKLVLSEGWITVTDTRILTSGQELSPQLSSYLVERVNGLSNLATRSDDIHFKFTKLKVKPGKGLTLTGTAEVNRLRFGRSK